MRKESGLSLESRITTFISAAVLAFFSYSCYGSKDRNNKGNKIVKLPYGLVYESDKELGAYNIWKRNPDGSETSLTYTLFDDTEAIVSPNTQWIFFVSNRTGSPGIYRMDVDGGNQIPITTTSPYSNLNPTVSPDNTEVAFTTNRDGDWKVYKKKSDGTGIELPISSGPGFDDTNPRWSPLTINEIAVVKGTAIAGSKEIYIIDGNGAVLRRLNINSVDDSYPEWTQNGQQITFNRRQISGDVDVYIMSSFDGSGEKNLSNDANGNDGFAAESPDGSLTLFTSTRLNGRSQVWIMNSDGSKQRIVIDDALADYLRPDWIP